MWILLHLLILYTSLMQVVLERLAQVGLVFVDDLLVLQLVKTMVTMLDEVHAFALGLEQSFKQVLHLLYR